MSQNIRYLSTTALSKELNMPAKDLFSSLQEKGWIIRDQDTWILTELGIEKGGVTKQDNRFGTWIAWPENISEEIVANNDTPSFINTTRLSEHFQLSKFRMNPILSELGWIQKERKGWVLTNLGLSLGGKQFEYERTGIPYVCWPESIVTHIRLLETINELTGGNQTQEVDLEPNPKGFREKFQAKLRTTDGHYVRSKAEMIIDNWLYMAEIVHAYERQLPVEEEVYCDFYLPVGKVYIEYWGLENDERYLERKEEKIKIYEKYGFHLIQLNEQDIQNLDDVFPKKLLKFGIQSY